MLSELWRIKQGLILASPYAVIIRMTAVSSSTTTILGVRVNLGERALLEAAAAQAHTNLSDFIRRKALEAAEADVLNRNAIPIAASDWDAFEAWIARPAEAVPDLPGWRN